MRSKSEVWNLIRDIYLSMIEVVSGVFWPSSLALYLITIIKSDLYILVVDINGINQSILNPTKQFCALSSPWKAWFERAKSTWTQINGKFKYSRDLNSQQVWCSYHGFLFALWIVCYSDALYHESLVFRSPFG